MLRMNFPESQKSFENLSRLWALIMIVCTDLFREVLSYYIKPFDLRLEADKHRRKLEMILNVLEKRILYPIKKEKPLALTDMDFLLLYKLLRNICHIPFSSGWGQAPQKGDKALGLVLREYDY